LSERLDWEHLTPSQCAALKRRWAGVPAPPSLANAEATPGEWACDGCGRVSMGPFTARVVRDGAFAPMVFQIVGQVRHEGRWLCWPCARKAGWRG
jgi:hypothetical protein